MKKRLAILLAVFYLLINSGAFVCLLSCGTGRLVGFLTSTRKHSEDNGRSKDQCRGGKNCSCCKKHGEFLVKENLKPAASFQILQVIGICNRSPHFSMLMLQPGSLMPVFLPDSKAPPPASGIPIFLQILSLLI